MMKVKKDDDENKKRHSIESFSYAACKNRILYNVTSVVQFMNKLLLCQRYIWTWTA